jgi:nucleotide-binding universal stress UspA family protein
MKKIVVAVDLSQSSRHTMAYGAMLAKTLGAEVNLLHVDTEPLPVSSGPAPWSVTTTTRLTARTTNIEKEAEALKAKYGIEVTGTIATGFKSESIAEAAATLEADLIVLGRKSDRHTKWLGSTALKVIRKTTRPVVIVPEETHHEVLKNIILAVDFHESATSTTFEPLFEIVKAFNASLRVLHVDARGADLKATEVPEKLQLGRILSKVDYVYDRAEFDNIEAGILQFVQTHRADLLVMVAHHHNFLERLSGSTHTQAVSSNLKVPLLVLK